MAARIEDDRNLTDGARRCARKLLQYVYRQNREARAADITVTCLMRALGKIRRTVQRYLRQLEHAGYITVEVIHARTRMCAGLMIQLLAPLLPRHGWQSSMKPDVPRMSQNDRSRYKTRLIPRVLWAIRCTDPIRRAWENIAGPLPALPFDRLSPLFSKVLLGEGVLVAGTGRPAAHPCPGHPHQNRQRR